MTNNYRKMHGIPMTRRYKKKIYTGDLQWRLYTSSCFIPMSVMAGMFGRTSDALNRMVQASYTSPYLLNRLLRGLH